MRIRFGNQNFLKATPWGIVYDNDPPPVVPPVITPPPVVPPPVEDDKPKFTQADVNRMLADNKRNLQKQVDTQVQELEKLKKQSGTTEQERERLAKQITTLNDTLLSKEELAAKETKRLQQEAQQNSDKLSKERDTWKSKFEVASITRAITDGAVTNEAFSPRQIVDLLKDKTRLVEVTNSEGNGTGEFIARVVIDDVDKENKPITLDLTVAEALKRMKERTDEFGNLFKSGVVGGLGGVGGKLGGKDKDPADMTPAEYRDYRNKNKVVRKTGRK
jgi:hypothetical protein